MAKGEYHVNNNGEVEACHADPSKAHAKGCPFGGSGHFKTAKEARKQAEKINELEAAVEDFEKKGEVGELYVAAKDELEVLRHKYDDPNVVNDAKSVSKDADKVEKLKEINKENQKKIKALDRKLNSLSENKLTPVEAMFDNVVEKNNLFPVDDEHMPLTIHNVTEEVLQDIEKQAANKSPYERQKVGTAIYELSKLKQEHDKAWKEYGDVYDQKRELARDNVFAGNRLYDAKNAVALVNKFNNYRSAKNIDARAVEAELNDAQWQITEKKIERKPRPANKRATQTKVSNAEYAGIAKEEIIEANPDSLVATLETPDGRIVHLASWDLLANSNYSVTPHTDEGYNFIDLHPGFYDNPEFAGKDLGPYQNVKYVDLNVNVDYAAENNPDRNAGLCKFLGLTRFADAEGEFIAEDKLSL